MRREGRTNEKHVCMIKDEGEVKGERMTGEVSRGEVEEPANVICKRWTSKGLQKKGERGLR